MKTEEPGFDRTDAATRFTEMYKEYRARVFAYAVSTVGRDLAEEIASEVFLIAWQRIAEVPEKPLPWLLVTTRNVGSNQVKAATRQRALAAEVAAWIADEHSSGDPADDVAERAALLAALSSLAEPDRELLTLTAWHGLSARSAARVIGCSPAAYFVRLHRARRRLGQAIAAASRGSAAARRPAAPADSQPDPVRLGNQGSPPPGADQWGHSGDHIAASPGQERFR
jgi:RNA polymerase sigma-70 factor (ECF subfamily)